MEKVAAMRRRIIIPLDDTMAIEAALLSHQIRLSMADSVILATARRYNATLWTQDAHFNGVEGVEFRAKNYE